MAWLKNTDMDGLLVLSLLDFLMAHGQAQLLYALASHYEFIRYVEDCEHLG